MGMELTYTKRDIPMELQLSDMDVEYIDHMGSDLDVVNAARVSFDVEHEDFVIGKDDKLIKYLADHNHWSPFAHQTLKFRVKAPFSIRTQLHKHQIGLVVNEVSRRYVDSPPEFYLPEVFRAKHENKKQGSDEYSNITHLTIEDEDGVLVTQDIQSVLTNRLVESLVTYQALLDNGVCPEQARFFLPECTMTTWIWTGSLAAFSRVCSLRLDPHAQAETREIAKLIYSQLESIFPISTKALLPNIKGS